MCFDVLPCAPQLLWEATALTLGHVALAPVCWQEAQDLLDSGGDNGEEEAHQCSLAPLGTSPEPGGRLRGVDPADSGLHRDHKSHPG